MRLLKKSLIQTSARLLAVIMAIAPALPFVQSAQADEPDCVCGSTSSDLVAGGGNEASALIVGEVIVSNCIDKVCVEYVLSDASLAEGWLITETHAHVGATVDDIPQTKKGNPIPGQFTHNESHDGVESLKICFDTSDSNVVVAAHAVVTKPVPGEWGQVWQIGDVEAVVQDSGLLTGGSPDWLSNYADEFNWADATPTTLGPGLAADEPAFANPFVVGMNTTDEFPYNSNTSRGYATDFDVEWTGALPWGGRLLISWSPGQSASENKVIDFAGSSDSFSANGVPSPGAGWFRNTYSLVNPPNELYVGALPDATHTINFRHTRGDGTFWDWIRLEQPGVTSETAWGDGEDFVGKNWATYIEYEVVDCCTEAPDSADATVTSGDVGQGVRRDGSPVLSQRSVLDSVKTDSVDLNSTTNTGFYSLGFGGDLIIEFPCPVVDGEGNDLRVVETTGGTYPLEEADVYAHFEGGWVYVGTVDNTNGTGLDRPGEVDFATGGVTSATRIKIVDVTDPNLFNTRLNADAYDVQYVEALNGACCPPAP